MTSRAAACSIVSRPAAGRWCTFILANISFSTSRTAAGPATRPALSMVLRMPTMYHRAWAAHLLGPKRLQWIDPGRPVRRNDGREQADQDHGHRHAYQRHGIMRADAKEE